jgi:hypothetical protein
MDGKSVCAHDVGAKIDQTGEIATSVWKGRDNGRFEPAVDLVLGRLDIGSCPP